jgi:hypothetical protein
MNGMGASRTTATAGPKSLPRLKVTSHRNRLLELEDRIFTDRRLRFYGYGVVVAWAIYISWLYFQDGWIIGYSDRRLGSLDFCWIWVTGKFATSGDPARIYDPSAFAAAQDVFYRPGECLFLHVFDYPPTLLFLTYPLAFMPYLIAFAAWIVSTLLLYLGVVYAIIPNRAAVIAALAPVPAVLNFIDGHNGFLTAGLFGLSLAFMEHRPWLSGIILSLLTYKPQFGVLFPFALFASRRWSVLASASATSVVLGLAAAIAFGFQAWPSFIDSIFNRYTGLSPDGRVELKLHSVFGLLHGLGASIWVSWAVQAVIAVIIAFAVCAIWVKPVPHPLKAAALCLGSLLVSPYVLGYDACILSIAVAFLVSDGISREFLPGERTAALICYTGLYFLLTPTLTAVPFICVILLLVVGRRIAAYEKGRLRSLSPVLERGVVYTPDDGAVRQGVNA